VPSHLWITGPDAPGRHAAWTAATAGAPAGVVLTADCHLRLRGIYTGVNTLVRQLVPLVYASDPELVHAHATTLFYLAPELDGLIAADVFRPIPTDVYREHRRFLTRAYSTVRPLLVAHGVVNFLNACAALPSVGHLSCFFDRVQAADELDGQVLAILVRRANPAVLTVAVGTDGGALPEPLAHALRQHTRPVTAAATAPPATEPAGADWAKAFVDSDGVSDLPWEVAAYSAADPRQRRQWHDERAEVLERRDDYGLRLGAIPYHRAHGRFPDTLGAAAYTAATEYVVDVGYYEAARRLGDLGRALVDRETQLRAFRSLFLDQDIPLLILRRTDEAFAVYRELRAACAEPGVQAHVAYGLAMLYARFLPRPQHDYTEARGWLNTALALARTLPDADLRAYLTAFEQNGLALVEWRLGRFDEAIRLETEAMELLDDKPGPHQYELYLRRALLSFNRSQVYSHLGRWDDAIADLTSVIDLFPQESDGYLERGNAHRRAGRPAEALADYHRAIARNPPPEAYFNRAGLLLDLGREEEARADYDTLLDLDPESLDGLAARAGLRYERGETAAARRDVDAGLALDPGHAALLCTLGLLEQADGRPEAARQALSRALERDPQLIAAWVNRAVLAFESGDTDGAVADLTEALARGEDAAARYNRAVAFQHRGDWQRAVDDFTAALSLDGTDPEDILARRAACHTELGRPDDARRDRLEAQRRRAVRA
jgi:tetratricopeptide (TPR) repeat protein